MAKKKKTKLKIPKEIAGVKVPKELRQKAKVAVTLAQSPMARELLAAGLAAAAAALTRGDNESKPAAAKDEAPEAPEATEAKRANGRRKRQALVAVAKDVAMGVATAYAEEARKKGRQNGSRPNGPDAAAS